MLISSDLSTINKKSEAIRFVIKCINICLYKCMYYLKKKKKWVSSKNMFLNAPIISSTLEKYSNY